MTSSHDFIVTETYLSLLNTQPSSHHPTSPLYIFAIQKCNLGVYLPNKIVANWYGLPLYKTYLLIFWPYHLIVCTAIFLPQTEPNQFPYPTRYG